MRVYSLGMDLSFILFHCLDSTDEVPKFYCEALHILKLPPLSLDPIAEQVKLNLSVFKTLSSTIEELNHKISSLGNIQPPSPPVVAMLLQCPLGGSLLPHTLVQDGKHKMYTVSSS